MGVEGEKQKANSGFCRCSIPKFSKILASPGSWCGISKNCWAAQREHLEFTIWYLKQKGYVIGPDNGRYIITAAGVDLVEEKGGSWRDARQPLLLEEAKAHPEPVHQN